MKITIETGGTVHMCGGEKCFAFGSFCKRPYCTLYRVNGSERKLRLKDGQPLRCRPCLESLVLNDEA